MLLAIWSKTTLANKPDTMNLGKGAYAPFFIALN